MGTYRQSTVACVRARLIVAGLWAGMISGCGARYDQSLNIPRGEDALLIDGLLIDGALVFQTEPVRQIGRWEELHPRLSGVDTVEVDPAGNVYVYDEEAGTVFVWSGEDPSEQPIETIRFDSTAATKSGPLGKIRAMSSGRPFDRVDRERIYLIDRVKERDPEFRIVTRPHPGSAEWKELKHKKFFARPNDLAVDVYGRLVVAEQDGAIEVLLPGA